MGGNSPKHGKTRRQANNDEDENDASTSGRQGFHRDQATIFHESLVPNFSGQDRTFSVAKWAQDIDENAEIFQWSPLQTLIIARRALVGTAALWLRSEKPFKSWEDLKAALLKEFPDLVDSKTIHEMMAARKKKRDESCIDYVLVMKEMGKRGKMPDYVAIKYIIDGIIDSEVNKMLLYGVTTYSELKEKIKIYETIKEKMRTDNSGHSRHKKPESHENGTGIKRCYSCGEKDHQSSWCPNKEKGLKCFKCNEFGHISTQCIRSTNEKTQDRERERRGGKPNFHEEKRTMCVTDFTPNICEAAVGTTDDIDRSTNVSDSDKMAMSVGTDTNFTDVYVEEKTPAKIKFENACKTIFINKCEVNALIDSGSEINLVCTELYVHLGAPESVNTVTNLVGLGGSIVSTQKFTACVSLDGHEYNDIAFHVVPRHALPCSVILGQEFLKDVFTIMSKGSILIAPNVNSWLSRLVCVVSQDEFVLGRIEDQQVKQEVIQCVKKYKPEQVKESPIELRIVLKDDVPVAQRPRRISLAEQQIVEKQVSEWLKDGIIRELIAKGILVIFIDDLLIPAIDECQALQRLKEVLSVASQYGLQINWKKAQLLCRRIEYLGHIIEDGKVQPSQDKTDAVTRYPEPKTLKQLHSFVGLTSYFRKYIKDFALIAKPLTDLLKKGVDFVFEDVQRSAFNVLKNALASSPVLRIYDPQLLTELHTDASAIAYSAILLQRDYSGELHPVHYYSRKTSDAEKKYSSYELEALAIIEGVKKFRHYLYGKHFKIITDCQAFQKTLNKKDLATRVARWVLLLEEYDYVIEHRPGGKMQHADALSRNPFVGAIELSLHDQVKQAQMLDEGIKAIIEIVKHQPYEDYIYSDGLLYKGVEKKLVIPRCLEFEILRRIHQKGHFGKRKMIGLLEQEYYIKNINKKIEEFLLSCIPCLLATKKEGKQEGFLNCIDKEGIPLHTIHCDHIGPLSETRKMYNYILTVVDGFTKFVWLFPVKGTTSKETIDKLKIHQQTFGNPIRLISDRGSAFTSNDFKEYCEKENIQHVTITTGVPRGNGQVERIHRIIIAVLTKLCIEEPSQWYKQVSRVQRTLNCTYQRSIDTTPFEPMLGTKMKTKEDIEIYDLLQQEHRSNFVQNREDLKIKAKEQIRKIQDENCKTFNRRRKESRKYTVGDVVAIKRTQFGVGLKLKPKYLGPYRVTKVKRNDRYDVEKMDHMAEGSRVTSSSADNMKPWPVSGNNVELGE